MSEDERRAIGRPAVAEPLTPEEALQILLPVRDALRRLDAARPGEREERQSVVKTLRIWHHAGSARDTSRSTAVAEPLRQAHDAVCNCPADGTDIDCNYRLNMADAVRAAAPLDGFAEGRRAGLAEAKSDVEWALREVAAGRLSVTDLLNALALVDLLESWLPEDKP